MFALNRRQGRHLSALYDKIKKKFFAKGFYMKRKEQRLLKKLEIEPVKGLIKTQKHFYSGLQNRLNEVIDPRDNRYTMYNCATLIGTGITKNICGIPTMQQMTTAFNNENCIQNISDFVGNPNEELPHYVTLNDFLKRLDTSELQKVRKDIVYHLMRMKSFDDARFQKKWLVIVDATWLQTYREQKDEFCMCREYKQEDGTKRYLWYRMALEAKIVLSDDLIISFDTEFIENNAEDAKRQKKMKADQIKQDCETKAFKRLAERMKKDFPRLPMILLCDSLYAGEPVFDICKKNKWNYVIRYKEGSIPGIMEEYEAIPEKGHGKKGKTEFVNGIGYKKHEVNVLKYEEKQVRNKEVVTIRFQWLTDLKITETNALDIACTGRKRWKIENEGFNMQKNLRYELEHANSHDWNALKNHYLITQIADIFRQLYVYSELKKLGLKKSEKNISSDMLASFGRQLTTEDISLSDMHSISDN